MISRITSIKDQWVIQARELITSAGRTKNKKCLLFGIENIRWALNANLPIVHIFVCDKEEDNQFTKELLTKNIPLFLVSEGILKKISDTNYVIPFVGVADTTTIMGDKKWVSKEFVIVMDRIQDHGNLGTIIRTAAAFGIHDLLSTSQDADIFFKKTFDASRGTIFSAHVTQFSSGNETIAALKTAGFQLVATSPHAKTLQSLSMLSKKPVALIVGNETEGISQELLDAADITVQIPMSKAVESLNVAVAAGISIYEIKLRIVLTMLTKKIFESLGRNLNVTAKYIQLAYNSYLKKITSLSADQVIFLMITLCDQFMSFERAAKDSGRFGDELEAFLQPLFDEKFVERKEEGGKQGFVLTFKGEDYLAKILVGSEVFDQEVLTGFSEADKTALEEYLKKIQLNCERIIQEE